MSSQSKLYDVYEQDSETGEAGMWITDLLVPVKIHALSSRRVRKVQADLARKYRQAELAGGGTLPPDKASAKATEVLARGIVSNWGVTAARADGVAETSLKDAIDVTDRAGTVLPFTVENASRVFADLPDFRDDILMLATNRETFRRASLEGLKGNSDASSSPDSSVSVAPSAA